MFEALAAPFPADKVSWRVGTSNKKKVQRDTGNNSAKATKGQVLAYIDARDVMDRLDEVVGPENWQDRYTHVDKKTVCEIDIWVEGRGWVTKADGAGDSDIEAEKGALSDAFKRAAVRWGIGRYLYHLPTPWVNLDEWERIPDDERRKLEALLTRSAPPKAEEPKLPTLAERADKFEATLKGVKPHEVEKAWEKGSALLALMSVEAPRRLADLTALYEGRKAQSTALTPADVPEFA
jgi:hypothetical protein